MEPLSTIEEKLARLVPPAISDGAQVKMESMIDAWAGVDVGVDLLDVDGLDADVLDADVLNIRDFDINHVDPQDSVSSQPWKWLNTRRKIGRMVASVAAVFVVVGLPVVWWGAPDQTASDEAALALLETISLPDMADIDLLPAEMVFLKSTRLIDAQENDGLIVPSDGTVPHYRYRYRLIDEELVKDPETGTVVTIRQPRQEVVTIPVTTF